ncbi:MAG: DoxX family protein [Pseudonocardiaceae bacterium]
MFTAYVVVAVLAAAANIYAATVDFMRADFILENMTKYGVPHSWLFPLGAIKAAGAVGLLVGIEVPPIGATAAAGLSLYYVGAIVTVLRAHRSTHVRYPTPFLLLAAATLVLQILST